MLFEYYQAGTSSGEERPTSDLIATSAQQQYKNGCEFIIYFNLLKGSSMNGCDTNGVGSGQCIRLLWPLLPNVGGYVFDSLLWQIFAKKLVPNRSISRNIDGRPGAMMENRPVPYP